MKKRLLAMILFSIISFRTDFAASTETIDTSKKSYSAAFNVLAYGDIFEKNISVVKMNNEYISSDFQHTHSIATSTNPLNYLVRQDPEVEGIGCGYFGINANKTNGYFNEYFTKTSTEDILIIKAREDTLTDEHISTLNASPANMLLLIAVYDSSDLSRFEAIIDQLSPRIKFALSDRTKLGIDAAAIERIILNQKIANLFYLALHNLNDENAARISQSQNFHNLVNLSVCRSNLSQIGALALAHSANFHALGQLVIGKKALEELTIDQYVEHIFFKDTLQSLVVLSYEPEFKQEIVTFN